MGMPIGDDDPYQRTSIEREAAYRAALDLVKLPPYTALMAASISGVRISGIEMCNGPRSPRVAAGPSS